MVVAMGPPLQRSGGGKTLDGCLTSRAAQRQDRPGCSPTQLRGVKVLGPISRHRVADILPHMKIVSRASRPGLLVGFLRIL